MAENIGIAWLLVWRVVWVFEAWVGACMVKAAVQPLLERWFR